MVNSSPLNGRNVGLAKESEHNFGHRAENGVAHFVTVGVVKCLEVVNVDLNDAGLVVAPAATVISR